MSLIPNFAVQEYQKDAIYRQMLEYKRENATLEARLEELDKRSTYHDDHIRVMDAWWIQVCGNLMSNAFSPIPC